MIDEVSEALAQYHERWNAYKETLHAKDFFDSLVPNSVGWKVATTADFDTAAAALRTHCDRVVHVWLNERWIAKCSLREPLPGGVRIIKLMQVRPGSADALGIDHVDFYTTKSIAEVADILKKEDCKTSTETNHPHFTWTSIWFSGTEAKIKDYTILDIEVEDLGHLSEEIKA